jgi:type II secretory pathway pseudopilin PulG
MSIVDVIFSRPEVILSLVFVALVLVAAVGLAVGPGIYRKMKKRSEARKAARAARLARQKQKNAKRNRNGGKQTAQPRRKRPAKVVEEEDEPGEVEDEGEEAAAAEEKEAEKPAEPTPAPAPPLPLVAAAQSTPEEKPAEPEAVSDIQNILDSVFVDEEANARYEALMRNIEVSSVEELVALASKVAGELRVRSQ